MTTPASSTPASALAEIINEKRAQKIRERCEKCQKRQFRARNGKFCDSQCPSEAETEGEEQEADLEVNVATEELTSTTTTANPEEALDTTTAKACRRSGRTLR